MDNIGTMTSGNSVKSAASGVHQAIDHLSDAAHPAVSDAASSAHKLVDRVAGGTNRVTERLHETGVKLKETGARLKEAELRMVDASAGYVREHPLKSVGIALAAGILVSSLVISRKSAASEKNSRNGG